MTIAVEGSTPRASTHRWSAPTTLAEALRVLAADPEARPIAGGTDLVVADRQGRRPLPASLVAIDRVAELSGRRVDGGDLVLGALTTHAWLAASPLVVEGWTALADASAIVGSPATRATGTLGGNLMNASPAAETVGPLIAAGAEAVLVSVSGERRVAVADLATGPGQTLARPDELLTEVRVPDLRGAGSAYVRLEYRQAMEIAIVGASAAVTVADGAIVGSVITLTAVAPTIIRAGAAEAALAGRPPDAGVLREAGVAAAAEASPISDVRASADYRRAMVAVVVTRALKAAIDRARGEAVPVPASRWAHGLEV